MAAKTVEEFLAALPADKRAALRKLRAAIKAAAPGTTEAISYGVPTVKKDGRGLVAYGAAAGHCTFYVMGYAPLREHAAALKPYRLGRGSIQFTADKPLPVTLVRKIVKSRLAELEKKGYR